MLYINLARSFNDLEPIVTLIRKLENPVNPITYIVAEQFLNQLFDRIRVGIKQHISVFCAHTSVYINYLIIKTNCLIIHLHQVNREMEDRMFLNGNEICLVTNFKLLTQMLLDLVVFFEVLGVMQHKKAL